VHADVGRYSVDGKVNGLTIGKSLVMARIYHKTVQAKKAHADWYPTLLQERTGAKHDPDEAVWRL
jgi:hypothetical protein